MTNQQPSSEFESRCGVKKKAETCPNNPAKCPVENQEDVKPPKTERSNLGMLSKGLTSDVEEDGCPVQIAHTNAVNLKKIEIEKAHVDVEDKLSKLSLQDTKSGKPPEKMGVKTENCVETASCDKAAKDLSNLLKTLSLGEEKSKNCDDSGVVSVLDDIDKSLAQLRLSISSSSSQTLKCRGHGDGPTTTSDPWSPWGGELDLQPAADLANYFSQQNGDMFGTARCPDQYGQTPLYPNYTWNSTVSGLNSTSKSIAFDPSQSTLTTSSYGNLYPDLTAPPSSQYKYPVTYSDRLPSTASYLDLLASEDDPSKHLSDNVSDDSLVLCPKRTKYTHEGSPLVSSAEPKVLYPTSDTSQFTHNSNNRFMTNSQPTNLYKSSQSEVPRSPDYSMGGSPSAQVYHSPAHRLSPESSLSCPYHSSSMLSLGKSSPTLSSSVSSGYNGDFAASSPGSVFSVCQSSALPDSPCSLGPYSPAENSSSYLSPQNSPTDSGLSTSHWSLYSPLNAKGSPISPTEPEPSFAPSVSAVSFSQVSASSPAALVSGSQVSQHSIICQDQMVPASPPAVSTTAMQPPTDESGNLLFEYTNEDGDSILHILVLIFETLVLRGQRKSAFSFLQYISRQFLKHPMMKQKLNKQNNMLQTPLYLAVERNLLPVVQLLVKSGANVDMQGRCEKLHEEVPHMDGPLHAAVRLGDNGVVLVKSLLSSNYANINTQNTEGETPLYIALKEHGSIYLDDKGQPQVKSCIKLIDVLLKHGADMDIKEYKCGKTPLMVAIETKDVALVRMVLDNCNPRDLHYLLNDSTRDLNTCMHIAFGLANITEPKHTELVRMLMMKGGEAESENNTNLKAKDMAPNIFKKAVKIFR